ncbi:MAG TPA: YebC/PmpR family DNA-binding transcriptional regulator [Tissierellia bacterium]|nr:YebC/PmpR family DNA-binding transcriptional regulator [Tissierellia bacterium]
MGRIGNIEGRKTKQDAKRAGMFTKLSRALSVAVKQGGPDPQYNAALVSAIEKAKAANMPNDNIERAIKKAAGAGDSEHYTEMIYEGYGPSGVAVMVECLSDNANRTAGDVRSYFTKNRGNLGVTGSVNYLFDHLGVLVIERTDDIDEEDIMMQAIDAGADDFLAEDDHFEIYTEVGTFSQVRDALKANGHSFVIAELRYLPKTTVSLNDEDDIKAMQRLIDQLEDHDDVQVVHHNWAE